MASQEEPRDDDIRGLPGAPAPHGTTADQEDASRREPEGQVGPQPTGPTPERNGEAIRVASELSSGGAVVSPSRPRGMASFPGGPPPTVTPAPALPAPPLPESPAAHDAPRFRVTTVETTAATRPAGPPPPATRPAPAPLA
ncbi:MAG TPA: hypothetical protein VFA46_04250, partial [Actinomycetes bacterium]|nr:hypothetical protein [Actinomycetes bacterium]